MSTSTGALPPHSPETQHDDVENIFHYRYSDFLNVGTSEIDGSMVWFSLQPLPGGKKRIPQYYTEDLDAKKSSELKIAWHPQFRLDRFEGTPVQQGVRRRDHLLRVIRENEAKPPPPKKPRAAPKRKAKRGPKPKPKGTLKTAKSDPKPAVAVAVTVAVTPEQRTSRKRPLPDESPVQTSANVSEEPSEPSAKKRRQTRDTLTKPLLPPSTTSSTPERATPPPPPAPPSSSPPQTSPASPPPASPSTTATPSNTSSRP